MLFTAHCGKWTTDAKSQPCFNPVFAFEYQGNAMRSLFSIPLCAAVLALALGAPAQQGSAPGPLRVLASNPRYFTDGSGKAVYLTGSHYWGNFQDNGHRLPAASPPPKSDFPAYLAFLEGHGHNFFRLWRWEVPKWTDEDPPGVKYCRPHPWLRAGPGAAADGEPRFDLARFDPEYFDRLAARVKAAGDRGMYLSVMLFEGWAVQFRDAWATHPFNRANNVNGIDADGDGDGRGVEFYTVVETPMGRQVLAAQENYLRKVVDTVGGFDNVLYEVCNEAGSSSTAWQYHVIRFVKEYESHKPKQHPVGMTFQYRGGSNKDLFAGPADWVSPNTGDPPQNYLEDPPANSTGKVIVNDTDHLCGHTCGDNVWVWKSFCRGLNVLFMEEMLPSPTWQDSARAAMGQTRRYAGKIDLAEMAPHDELASVKYCLAKPGGEYLVFQPGSRGQFTVNLKDAPGAFAVEWLNINADRVVAGKPVEGGGTRVFITPFGGPAALYLKLLPR
jgi:hypothetical protein